MTWPNWSPPLYDPDLIGNLYTQDALKGLSSDTLRIIRAQSRVIEGIYRRLGRYEGLPAELQYAYEKAAQKAAWEIEVISAELGQREEEE